MASEKPIESAKEPAGGEKPKKKNKKMKGPVIDENVASTEDEKSPFPYGQINKKKNELSSPFLKGNVKSTPNSTMNRLLKVEQSNVNAMRRLSIENKEQKEIMISEKQVMIEHDCALLALGTYLLKVPHRGPARRTKFYVKKENDKWIITWDSKNKSKTDSTFPLKQCLCALGQGQGLFKERTSIGKLASKDQGHSRLSFTLMFQERTVDVMAENEADFNRWCRVLKHVGVILDTHSGYS